MKGFKLKKGSKIVEKEEVKSVITTIRDHPVNESLARKSDRVLLIPSFPSRPSTHQPRSVLSS